MNKQEKDKICEGEAILLGEDIHALLRIAGDRTMDKTGGDVTYRFRVLGSALGGAHCSFLAESIMALGMSEKEVEGFIKEVLETTEKSIRMTLDHHRNGKG